MGGLSAKKPTKTTWVNKFPFTTLLSHWLKNLRGFLSLNYLKF
jgi:hypothetical protein